MSQTFECPHCHGVSDNPLHLKVHATACQAVAQLNADIDTDSPALIRTEEDSIALNGRTIPAGSQMIGLRDLVDRVGVTAMMYAMHQRGQGDHGIEMLRSVGVADIDLEASAYELAAMCADVLGDEPTHPKNCLCRSCE